MLPRKSGKAISQGSNEVAVVTPANEMHLELLDEQSVDEERRVECTIDIMAYKATEVARKLLSLLRACIRKKDKLSINGPGSMPW